MSKALISVRQINVIPLSLPRLLFLLLMHSAIYLQNLASNISALLLKGLKLKPKILGDESNHFLTSVCSSGMKGGKIINNNKS